MKKQLNIILFFLFAFSTLAGYCQQECKVLLPALEGTYDGKCKKGLANGKGKAVGKDTYEGQFVKGLPSGKGTYYWANGDVYEGEWLFGKREGKGIFTFKYDGKDSVLAGLWQSGEYTGPVPAKPRVTYMANVDRYTFLKYGYNQNRVLITLMQNGSVNKGITGLRTITNSGTNVELGNSFGYNYIVFPVTIKVSYTTYNKLRTATYLAIFEFTISEPGDWEVTIYN